MSEVDESAQTAGAPSRRSVATAGAWAAPLMVAAVSAPAAQASTAPPVPFTGLVGTWSSPTFREDSARETTFTVTNTSSNILTLNGLLFDLSNKNEYLTLLIAKARAAVLPAWALGDSNRYAQVLDGSFLFYPGVSITVNATLSYVPRGDTYITVREYRDQTAPTQFDTVYVPARPPQ